MQDRRTKVEQIVADPDNPRWTPDDWGLVWEELEDLWQRESATASTQIQCPACEFTACSAGCKHFQELVGQQSPAVLAGVVNVADEMEYVTEESIIGGVLFNKVLEWKDRLRAAMKQGDAKCDDCGCVPDHRLVGGERWYGCDCDLEPAPEPEDTIPPEQVAQLTKSGRVTWKKTRAALGGKPAPEPEDPITSAPDTPCIDCMEAQCTGCEHERKTPEPEGDHDPCSRDNDTWITNILPSECRVCGKPYTWTQKTQQKYSTTYPFGRGPSTSFHGTCECKHKMLFATLDRPRSGIAYTVTRLIDGDLAPEPEGDSPCTDCTAHDTVALRLACVSGAPCDAYMVYAEKAHEPEGGELLPCPLPGCRGKGELENVGPGVVCSECEFGCRSVDDWQSLPRRSAEVVEVVREMDGEIAEGGDAIEMCAVRSWRDKLAGSAPAEPSPEDALTMPLADVEAELRAAGCDVDALGKRGEALAKRLLSQRKAEPSPDAAALAEALAANERDRSKVAEVMSAVLAVIRGYNWATESRGPYRYDDDEFFREFGRCLEAVNNAISPLGDIAKDLTSCPTTQGEVDRVRRLQPEPAPAVVWVRHYIDTSQTPHEMVYLVSAENEDDSAENWYRVHVRGTPAPESAKVPPMVWVELPDGVDATEIKVTAHEPEYQQLFPERATAARFEVHGAAEAQPAKAPEVWVETSAPTVVTSVYTSDPGEIQRRYVYRVPVHGAAEGECDIHPEANCGTCGECDEHKELVVCYACHRGRVRRLESQRDASEAAADRFKSERDAALAQLEERRKAKKRADKACSECLAAHEEKLETERQAHEETRRAERSVSDAYLRIREIMGAWNTKPGGVDRFEVTEAAVRGLKERLAELEVHHETACRIGDYAHSEATEAALMNQRLAKRINDLCESREMLRKRVAELEARLDARHTCKHSKACGDDGCHPACEDFELPGPPEQPRPYGQKGSTMTARGPQPDSKERRENDPIGVGDTDQLHHGRVKGPEPDADRTPKSRDVLPPESDLDKPGLR